MYSSVYYRAVQTKVYSKLGVTVDILFDKTPTEKPILLKDTVVVNSNRLKIIVNSKCSDLYINLICLNDLEDRLLLHIYDMCNSIEAQVLLRKIKETFATNSSQNYSLDYINNSNALTRCWAWIPELKNSILTDLTSIKELTQKVSHICLEGHKDWIEYEKLN
jgi:hypothetical protein